MFSRCPAGPRSPIHPGRLQWQTHHKVCLALSFPGRGLSRHCSEWPDGKNTNTACGKVLDSNVSQYKPSTSNTTSILKLLVLDCGKSLLFRCSGFPYLRSFPKHHQRALCGAREIPAWFIRYVNISNSCFSLTYWKLDSPFLVQPMRYRATSGAPCSQVALKLVWVTSENLRFFGAGTTSAE